MNPRLAEALRLIDELSDYTDPQLLANSLKEDEVFEINNSILYLQMIVSRWFRARHNNPPMNPSYN